MHGSPSRCTAEAESTEIKGAVGNVLADGDTVTVIKHLKTLPFH